MSMSVEMILRLIDQATGPLRGVTREMDHLKASTAALNAQKSRGSAAGAIGAHVALKEQAALAAAAKAEEKYAAAIASRAALAASAAGAAGVGAAAYGLKQAIQLDKDMADLKKKVTLDQGATWASVEQMLNGMAVKFGMAREQVFALASSASAAGTDFKDLESSVELSVKAASAWDMSAQEAGQSLAYIKSAAKMSKEELRDFADMVNYAADTSGAKESDLVNMFLRSAEAAKAAGVPYKTTLAALTAMKDGGMQPEVASRFWNAFSSRLATASKGGRGAKDLAEGLKMLGMSIKEVDAGMKSDPTGTIFRLFDGLEKVGNPAKAGVQIMGREYWDEFSRLGKGGRAKMREELDAFNSGAWKGSLDKNMGLDLGTTETKLKQVNEIVRQIGTDMMRWALPTINTQLDKMVSSFENLKKTGFLPGPDGKPIDRLKDKTPVPFSDANRALFLRHQASGEGVDAYGRRLGLDRPIPTAPPAPIFTQPRPQAPQGIPGGFGSLPSFAAGPAAMEALNRTVTPKVDTSQITAAEQKAKDAGQAIQSGLNVSAKPIVDSSSISEALKLASQLNAELSRIGAAAPGAARAVASSGALHDGPEAH